MEKQKRVRKKKELTKKIELPEGVTLEKSLGVITAKGPKGEASKKIIDPKVEIIIEKGKATIKPKVKGTQREKKLINTFNTHIKNLVQGVTEGHTYKLKICSSHFPMTVAVKDGKFEVKNFFGENVPRVLELKQGADVKIDGEEITVESASKETAGQVAADIEQLTRRVGFDRRIFQDGIYITEKDGKEIK